MEDLLNKEPVKRVSQKLKHFDESLSVIVLDSSARTAQDAANSLNTEVGSIVKSLFLRTKNSFLLCLDQVKEITGFTIGGVSPVAHLNPLKIYIDESLSRFKNIYGAAGHPNCVFKIDFENLQKITNGEVMDISE